MDLASESLHPFMNVCETKNYSYYQWRANDRTARKHCVVKNTGFITEDIKILKCTSSYKPNITRDKINTLRILGNYRK